MKHKAKSVRTFIGAKNFDESRNFYKELGFEEFSISKSMSYFKIFETLGFYLQDFYLADWINNSMVFLEVDNVEEYFTDLQTLGLHHNYKGVKLTPIKNNDWGKECFLHDPSGVLWHFGAFNK
jgi:catechol 2,3-dioxygenase-like lactoylglutathione lyase family enzyme